MAEIQDLLAVIVMLFGYLSSARADVTCHGEEGIQRIQQQCFLDQGINITLPTYTVDGSISSRKKNYIQAVLAQKADILCTNQRQLQQSMECSMSRAIECMPEEYKGYLPQPSAMAKVVATLCNSDTKIDFECAKNKVSELYDCGLKKGQEAFSAGKVDLSVPNVLCKTFQFSAECQRSELKSCGCSTVRAYEIVSSELLYPPSCPRLAMAQSRVQCQEANQEAFIDNGQLQLSGSSVTLFALLSLLAVKCLF